MANEKNNGSGNSGSNQDEGGRFGDIADTARDRLTGLGSTTSDSIDHSPLIALGAGAAIGAVLAAVLPASQRERELLAPVGSKLTQASTDAIDRARDMSRQKFDEMAGDKVREFFGVAGGTSGKA